MWGFFFGRDWGTQFFFPFPRLRCLSPLLDQKGFRTHLISDFVRFWAFCEVAHCNAAPQVMILCLQPSRENAPQTTRWGEGPAKKCILVVPVWIWVLSSEHRSRKFGEGVSLSRRGSSSWFGGVPWRRNRRRSFRRRRQVRLGTSFYVVICMSILLYKLLSMFLSVLLFVCDESFKRKMFCCIFLHLLISMPQTSQNCMFKKCNKVQQERSQKRQH